MKRTFLVAISAVSLGILGGCTKNDILQSNSGSEVSFSTHVNGTTKGSTKVDFKIGDQFGLMATESAGSWTNTDANWYMGGGNDASIVVTNSPLSNGTGAWKYSPIKNWPEVNKVSFFAYSPISDGANGISNVKATAGSPTLDFEVNSVIKEQVDLLRAEALNKHEEEVQLAFSHALTRVTFAAKANVTTNQRVRLDKIELKGIKNSGTLKLYDDARVIGALEDMGGWSGQTGAVNYDLALTHEVASLVTTDLMPMTADDQALFMIPQKFTADKSSVLEVTYSYSNDGGSKWVNGSKFAIDLGEYTQYWNPSKNYRYVLTLAPENVYSFAADIVDWGSDINVTVTNPFSVASLVISATGGAEPSEVVITETRGEELGYTLKSSASDWITISDAKAGPFAGEVTYKPDGSIETKAYEMEKKWYIKTLPNTTGVNREGYVEIIRKGLDAVKLEIAQAGFSPLKNCVYTPSDGDGSIQEVTGMAVPNDATSTYKLKTNNDWILLSNDGVEANAVKELAVTRTGETQSFYVHTTTRLVNSERDGSVSFEITDVTGASVTAGTTPVKQKAQLDKYVGNFAGTLKTETVGAETHYYFDKMLFAASADESGKPAWQNTASATTAKSLIDGKANTLALKNLGGTPAATACWNKSSTPANMWYLPAQNQLMSMWIAKNNLGTFASDTYWSSTEYNSGNAWYVNFTIGVTVNFLKDYTGNSVRCVREHSDAQIPVGATKVIKDASGKVYIDVQGMPSGTWRNSSLAGTHNEASANNSLFKRIEIDKSDKPKAAQTSPGCSSGWRLPTQRELQLMWIMKDALVKAGVNAFTTTGNYWSSTESNNSSYAWYVAFNTGITNSDNIKTTANNIRCIREVN